MRKIPLAILIPLLFVGSVSLFLLSSVTPSVLFLIFGRSSSSIHAAEGYGPVISLAQSRRGFTTKLIRKVKTGDPVLLPPPNLFRVVQYPSQVGPLAAYISPPPGDGKKHPAIIWIFGGWENSIDDTAWKPASPEDDQSARAFREAGVMMMYPSLRGGNTNPGFKEGLYGEVDDVLAAADFLARQPSIDPQRIYLGGHSTGGTLALLTAECTGRFRAVFSFGPVTETSRYDIEYLPFDIHDPEEVHLRSASAFLPAISSPTFLFEGEDRPSNYFELKAFSRASKNPLIHCYVMKGKNHGSILAAVTPVIAAKILRDTGSRSNIGFSQSG